MNGSLSGLRVQGPYPASPTSEVLSLAEPWLCASKSWNLSTPERPRNAPSSVDQVICVERNVFQHEGRQGEHANHWKPADLSRLVGNLYKAWKTAAVYCFGGNPQTPRSAQQNQLGTRRFGV